MQMQVGALARATGLTVRTLHHYDEIGLVKPSGRSESGYRLYDEADVARLHAVQALRQLGLPLAEIGPLLDDRQAGPEHILEQQMHALDRQIRQAGELRERLALLLDSLRRGAAPAMDDWVRSLSLMTTYTRYFSADELRTIFRAFDSAEDEWEALKREARACMDDGAAPGSDAAQALTRRWIALMHRVMGGDFALMERWGAMFRQEPSAHGHGGAPPTDMIAYVESAIALRVELLRQHYGDLDFRRVRQLPDEAWRPIEAAGRKLLAAGTAPTSGAARRLRQRWQALLQEMAGGDAALLAKLETSHRADPRLVAGAPLSAEVREFLLGVPQKA